MNRRIRPKIRWKNLERRVDALLSLYYDTYVVMKNDGNAREIEMMYVCEGCGEMFRNAKVANKAIFGEGCPGCGGTFDIDMATPEQVVAAGGSAKMVSLAAKAEAEAKAYRQKREADTAAWYAARLAAIESRI